MKSWERDKMMREEGEARLAKLIEILQSAGRSDDILHAAQDAEAREQLYKEFNLE